MIIIRIAHGSACKVDNHLLWMLHFSRLCIDDKQTPGSYPLKLCIYSYLLYFWVSFKSWSFLSTEKNFELDPNAGPQVVRIIFICLPLYYIYIIRESSICSADGISAYFLETGLVFESYQWHVGGFFIFWEIVVSSQTFFSLHL